MTKNDALLPCPLPDCKDNKITRGYESGPMLYYVCCASPQHVLKVYGITQAFADERWNTRATPSHVAVDAKAVDAAITDAVHLIDYAMRGGHVHKREWQKVINGLLTAPKPDSKPQEVSVEDIAKACIKDWCADYFRMVLLAFEHAAELYPNGVKIVKDKA